MSKDKLLNESTIRRFQKLAKIGAINETGKVYVRDEEELPAEAGEELELGAEGVALEEPLADEEAVLDDLAAGEELGAEEAEEPAADAEIDISPEELEGALPFLKKVVTAAEEAADEGAADDELAPELEEPAGEELELEPAAEEFDLPSEGEAEEELALEEVMKEFEKADIQVVPSNKDKLVEKIARRVEAYMQKQRKEKEILEEVTKRVAKRLLKYTKKK